MKLSKNYEVFITSDLYRLVIPYNGAIIYLFSRIVILIIILPSVLFIVFQLFRSVYAFDIQGVFFMLLSIPIYGFLVRLVLNQAYWLSGSEEILQIDRKKRKLHFYRKGFWPFDSVEIGFERILTFDTRSKVDKKYGEEAPGDFGFGTNDGPLSLVYSNMRRSKVHIYFGVKSWKRLNFGTSLSKEEAGILAKMIASELRQL